MHTPSIAQLDIDHEVAALTAEIFSTHYGMSWCEATVQAFEQLPELLAYSAAWDADAADDTDDEEDSSIQYEGVPYPHGIGNPDARVGGVR